MIKKTYLFCIIFTFFSLFSSESLLIDSNFCNNLSLYNSGWSNNSSDAQVLLVKDNNTNMFIIKQISEESLDEQFLLINDLIASHIGYCLGINVNKVSLIPAKLATPLKLYSLRAATLHCLVPGSQLEHAMPSFLPSYFTVQQRVINHNSPWQKKYPFKNNQQGLTSTIIQSMSMHKDLPAIIAFDTYCGNADRSLPNIFYDIKTDHFYGIDHAAAFTKKLPALAYDRLSKLKESGYFNTCSKEIINGLQLYRNTLHALWSNNSPEVISNWLKIYAKHITIHDTNASQIINERVVFHTSILYENHKTTEKLIDLLDTILNKLI